MLELKNDNLNEVLSSNENVFVMYGASWCGACKMSKPKVNRLAGENQSVQFVYVDAEHMIDSRELAGKLSNLPTFVAFKNGVVIEKEAGTKLIEKVLNVLK